MADEEKKVDQQLPGPERFAPPRVREAAVEAVRREVEPPWRYGSNREQTLAQQVAALLLKMPHGELAEMCGELHSDSTAIGKTINDVVQNVWGWAQRKAEPEK